MRAPSVEESRIHTLPPLYALRAPLSAGVSLLAKADPSGHRRTTSDPPFLDVSCRLRGGRAAPPVPACRLVAVGRGPSRPRQAEFTPPSHEPLYSATHRRSAVAAQLVHGQGGRPCGHTRGPRDVVLHRHEPATVASPSCTPTQRHGTHTLTAPRADSMATCVRPCYGYETQSMNRITNRRGARAPRRRPQVECQRPTRAHACRHGVAPRCGERVRTSRDVEWECSWATRHGATVAGSCSWNTTSHGPRVCLHGRPPGPCTSWAATALLRCVALYGGRLMGRWGGLCLAGPVPGAHQGGPHPGRRHRAPLVVGGRRDPGQRLVGFRAPQAERGRRQVGALARRRPGAPRSHLWRQQLAPGERPSTGASRAVATTSCTPLFGALYLG